ncbi:hypothetical protein L7F22_016614 [Adiantum nelumboides]|nr:hypothetical protein [Adiantum nelumboides]
MADNNIDVFKMFAAEDRLNGDNYPMWAYMMQHVLVSKGVWNIVQGIDVRPGSVDVAEVVDVAGPSTRIAAARSVLPTAEQARWDVKDAQAHALIALSLKRTITPHIHSAKSAKQAWDILTGLYAEAKKKEGGSTTNDGSTTNAAIVVSSVKEDSDADAEWAFSAECTYNPAVHDACMLVLLSMMHGIFWVVFMQAKEAKKKEGGSTTNDGSTTNAAIVVVKKDSDADAECAFSTECTYNPAVHDACMSVAADSHVWYFDNGATKHITSHRDLFTSLESVPHGNSVTCANNASYPVQGVGKIVLTAANGSSFTLVDALYVPGIKKNILFVSALARLGLVVKFVDDRCTVNDLSFGDEIVASGILCRGLYKFTLYDKCGKNFANAVVDTKAISDAKLWHARFGHLNFVSLLRLQKSDMVASLPPLEAPVKHVCEGCILDKMQRSKFPKDGSVRATCRLQLVHSDICGPMQTPSLGNYLYFVTFIDYYSRHAWVFPLEAKFKVFMCFKQFLAMAENVSKDETVEATCAFCPKLGCIKLTTNGHVGARGIDI